MLKVDLNCDLGESFGDYKIGRDTDIIPHISSANIACGWHAGDPNQMQKTLEYAKQYNVAVGAHPGLLDLMGFGRRNMDISREEAKAYTLYQLGAFYAFSKANNIKVQHVKPHGALYNMAAKDIELARGICEAIYSFEPSIILLALSGSKMVVAAKEVGLKVACEVFADRNYNSDGSLVSRRLPNSVIHDTQLVVKRILKMIKYNKVMSVDGTEIDIVCDSICVHGDNEKAVEFVKYIRKELQRENIMICNLEKVI